jgi:arginyl-tRNA synthetase
MINFHKFTEILEEAASNSQIAKLAASLIKDQDRVLNIKPTADNEHLLRLIAFNRHELENNTEDELTRSRRMKAIEELKEELTKRGVANIEEEIEKLFKRN